MRRIRAVLEGKRVRLMGTIKRDMESAAKKEDFERASKLRDELQGMENIFEHRYILEAPIMRRRGRVWPRIEEEIRAVTGAGQKIRRVEGYDISNISGVSATGSMVVFINGKPVRSRYRKFKIKTVRQANDVAMHEEVMRRRLMHTEWGMPDLVVIDGGKPQLHAVEAVLRPGNESIRLVALAKREEELYREGIHAPVRLDSLSPGAMLFFQHVRDESHRFAKKYHHKLRELSYNEKRR